MREGEFRSVCVYYCYRTLPAGVRHRSVKKKYISNQFTTVHVASRIDEETA